MVLWMACPHAVEIAAVTLVVPFKVCPNSGCRRQLVQKPPTKGVLYTASRGILPVLCPSMYCNGKFEENTLKEPTEYDLGCRTRFYNNFKVQNASQPDAVRIFYQAQLPQYIQVTDHLFVDKGFCTWVEMELADNR